MPGPGTVAGCFAAEQRLLKALSDEPFETGRWSSPLVDRYSTLSIRTNRYSVPVRLIGQRVRVLLHASEVVIYDGRTEIVL
ncbi:hypothetical protein AB0M29_45235 [Streptomyces sp. NPDC051976]|uniref:Mu transposase domain-containing protein n=1 Tax=Streptomyces sp. NPDC051976 TaxID=3154947 RepID=UPI00343900E1